MFLCSPDDNVRKRDFIVTSVRGRGGNTVIFLDKTVGSNAVRVKVIDDFYLWEDNEFRIRRIPVCTGRRCLTKKRERIGETLWSTIWKSSAGTSRAGRVRGSAEDGPDRDANEQSSARLRRAEEKLRRKRKEWECFRVVICCEITRN